MVDRTFLETMVCDAAGLHYNCSYQWCVIETVVTVSNTGDTVVRGVTVVITGTHISHVTWSQHRCHNCHTASQH